MAPRRLPGDVADVGKQLRRLRARKAAQHHGTVRERFGRAGGAAPVVGAIQVVEEVERHGTGAAHGVTRPLSPRRSRGAGGKWRRLAHIPIFLQVSLSSAESGFILSPNFPGFRADMALAPVWSPQSHRRIMKRFLAFSLVAWLAAALLILGRDSVSMIALSGVVALAGLDIFQP
ncbi:hypothetical protein GCM10027081_21840 [Cupriavidus yeoncheonensis]